MIEKLLLSIYFSSYTNFHHLYLLFTKSRFHIPSIFFPFLDQILISPPTHSTNYHKGQSKVGLNSSLKGFLHKPPYEHASKVVLARLRGLTLGLLL